MHGRPAVAALARRLDAAFERANGLVSADFELQSDFARYLCVLLSGFLESAVSELAIDHCRNRSNPSVARFADRRLARLTNLRAERLLQILGDFDLEWRRELESFIEGERKQALDAVVDLRNKIAHGESVGLTYTRIKAYCKQVREIVEFIATKLD